MTSYNKTNGLYMSQNGRLNNDILKNEWGFDGIIMSDWTSTFDGVEAANGGLDLEMPSAEAMNRNVLRQAIEQGKVSVETLNDKVRRILGMAVRYGWLDRDQMDRTAPRYNRNGSDVALDAARSSMVLLKNEAGFLPFKKEKIKSIAVIGPNAYPAVAVGGGSARVVPFRAVSFLEGLSDGLIDYADVYYHKGIPSPSEIGEETKFYISPGSKKPGLRLELFHNVGLSGSPVHTCVERQVGTGDCSREVSPPLGSMRWTGYFAPSQSGEYDVVVQIPGERIGYRLYVDQKIVMDAWNYPKALLDTERVSMDEGVHEVVLEVARRGGGYSGGKLRMGITAVHDFVDPEAVSLASQAEAVIVTVGFNSETESESGDRSFQLPPGQDTLIQKIVEANNNTVVVLTSGGGIDTSAWHEKVPAIIATWYPGQEGGIALSEILLGENNPSGRLPVSWEKRQQDNPAFENYYPEAETDRVLYREGVFVGYRGYEKKNVKPLFPFGFGLSYTQFEYSDLEIKPILIQEAGDNVPESKFEVSFDLENTGERAGAEVAQIYVRSSGKSVPRPLKELKGFEKITLEPGERKRIAIRLDRRAFCYYDTQKEDWQIEAGDREILVGRSSEEIVLRGKVTLNVLETAVD